MKCDPMIDVVKNNQYKKKKYDLLNNYYSFLQKYYR